MSNPPFGTPVRDRGFGLFMGDSPGQFAFSTLKSKQLSTLPTRNSMVFLDENAESGLMSRERGSYWNVLTFQTRFDLDQ